MGVLPNEEFGRDALCLASTTIESHSVFIRDSFAIRDDRSKRGSCPLYRHPALCLERSGECRRGVPSPIRDGGSVGVRARKFRRSRASPPSRPVEK